MGRRAKVLVAAAGVAVCLALWNHGKNGNELEKQAEETEIQKGTVKYEKTDQGQSQRSLSFINLEGLYFLNSEGEMLFKSAFEKWMNDKTVSNVEVTGVIEELEDGTGYLFYLTCDNGQSVRAEYLEGAFSFSWVQSEASQLLDGSSVPEKSYQEQQEELEALRAEQNVSIPEGEEAGSVVIMNQEQLPDGFSEEMTDEITSFLVQEGELRRELYFTEETEEGYLFSFKNERADKKSVLVSFHGSDLEITLTDLERRD